MVWRKKQVRRSNNKDIDPDEIFLDDKNIPEFDVHQFEGRIDAPIGRRMIVSLSCAFIIIALIMLTRALNLEVWQGKDFARKSEANRLEHQLLFPERGVITDRNGVNLAWNYPSDEDIGFSLRGYTVSPGFGGLLGYLHYPARDVHGVFYRRDYEADVGIEAYYNEQLKGKSGLRIIETDALGHVMSSNTIDPPLPGDDIKLTIDSKLQSLLYKQISRIAREEDYLGGAGAVMDVHTGEVLALVSYPDFDPNIMTAATDTAKIAEYNKDKGSPFLNRVIGGLFTPGSIVKPIFALGALSENIIGPETPMYTHGYILVPNPYNPDKPSRFNDWQNQGVIDMRSALEWSSDVYFYEIAGGFEGQKGLGIRNVEKYARMFGFGTSTGLDLYGEVDGTIPNPEWKAKTFPTDPNWRIGDTYFTGIGQYGMQISVMQALREAATIAANGKVVQPHLNSTVASSSYQLPIPKEDFKVIHEGMRKVVTNGTATILNVPVTKVAAKTGTAELGVTKVRVNSWVIGFFPYDKPKYAFAIVMDRGVKGNTTNASYVAQKFFWAMASSTPEYLKGETSGDTAER